MVPRAGWRKVFGCFLVEDLEEFMKFFWYDSFGLSSVFIPYLRLMACKAESL